MSARMMVLNCIVERELSERVRLMDVDTAYRCGARRGIYTCELDVRALDEWVITL